MAKTAGMSGELFAALKGAGLADDDTRRVVIDIGVDRLVTVYIEKYANGQVIDVVNAVGGVEVIFKTPETREDVS